MSVPAHAVARPQKAEVRPVSQPQDRQEREAERAAAEVAHGGTVAGWSFSAVSRSAAPVQRQDAGKPAKPKSNEDKEKEALLKAGEAALKTKAGKALTDRVLADPGVKKLKDFATSPAGIAVESTLAAGGIVALGAAHKPLPFQPPAIPLDKITPGLSAQITYQGPVDKPTFVGLTITFKEQGPKGKKGPSESERYAAETARLAAANREFQSHVTYAPGSKEAEDERMFQEALTKVTGLGELPGFTVPLPAPPKKDEQKAPVQRAPAAETAAAPREARVDDALAGGGRPLDPATRRTMEARFGRDFSEVRIHDDARAAATAASIDAAAFTVGQEVAFAGGRYAPSTAAGRELLAHELAHTIQQRGGGRGVQRQQARQSPQGGGATFSVPQRDYEQRVRAALGALGGQIPRVVTFAPAVRPILEAMFARVTWRDAAGADHGGGVYRYTIPGTRTTLHLRLVLDDVADPPQAGEFQSTGTSGTILVKVRSSQTADQLTEVLYHESMHLMTWIINTHHGASAAAGVERRGVRTLDLSRHGPQIAAVRVWLDDLASRANPRRRTAGRPQIAPAALEHMSRWLVEEVLVRAETEVFEQTLQVESQRGRRAQVYMPTQQYGAVNGTMVDRYVYEFSRTFEPADRAGSDIADQEALRRLTDILEGMFQISVRRRFSLTAYTLSVPRERPRIPLTPLTPPSFTGRIGGATGGAPFR